MSNAIKRLIRTGLSTASGALGAKRLAENEIATEKRQRTIDELNRMLGYSRIEQANTGSEANRARTKAIQNPPKKSPAGFGLSAGEDRYEFDPLTGQPKVVASRPDKPEKTTKSTGKVSFEIAPGFTVEGENVDDVAKRLHMPKEDMMKLLGAAGTNPAGNKGGITRKDVKDTREKMQLEHPDDNPDSLTAAIISGAQHISDSLGIGRQPTTLGDLTSATVNSLGAGKQVIPATGASQGIFDAAKSAPQFSAQEQSIIDYAKKTGRAPDWLTLGTDGFDVPKLKAALGYK
jgi:hypothetical protein